MLKNVIKIVTPVFIVLFLTSVFIACEEESDPIEEEIVEEEPEEPEEPEEEPRSYVVEISLDEPEGSSMVENSADSIIVTVELDSINATGEAIDIDYKIEGTAEDNMDFGGLSGVVSIPHEERFVELKVFFIDDEEVEIEETVQITLIDPTSDLISLGSSQSVMVTILDNDDDSEPPLFVWENWYLSVPIDKGDGSGDATSIKYSDIEANSLTEEESQYFYLNDEDGSYTMFTKFTGFTTSGYSEIDGSKYCRTELREYWRGRQSTSDNWPMTGGGKHVLESTLQVESCGGEGRTFVAQIHGATTFGLSGSPATVKVEWNNGDIVIEYYTKPLNGSSTWTSSSILKPTIGTVDHEKFTIKLKVEEGVLYYDLICEAKGLDTGYQMLYDYAGNDYEYENYFKTGNYFRWNGDYTETSQVILYQAITKHVGNFE